MAMLQQEMHRAGGSIPFDRFMELALYAPGLGYYVSGARKFGPHGDFVTAPEISPLFGCCLARQVDQVLTELGGGDILEFGAGSGVMAADLLSELQRLGRLPQRYLILELSAELQARQRCTLAERVPNLADRVVWCERLPGDDLHGVILANELLDAMPVHRFRVAPAGLEECFVGLVDGRLVEQWRPATAPGLIDVGKRLLAPLGDLAIGYRSEVNLRLAPWLRALGMRLRRGAAILIDYGYVGREYYHPERHMGTLVCHYRHRAHGDPLGLPGLQDITANVDFSALAEAAIAADFTIGGFSTQAHFLFGCGLEQLIACSDVNAVAQHVALMQGVKKLTLPGEMGERFKVMALTRGLEQPLIGFSVRDFSDRL
jgi:SAM-dependent MidA family methyltransferase